MSRQTQQSVARDARILKAYHAMDKGYGVVQALAERFGCSPSYISRVITRSRHADASQQTTTEGIPSC